MKCEKCLSENVRLLKSGIYHTGWFCNDCGHGEVDFYNGTCCGNQNLVDIRFEQVNGTWVQRVACSNCRTLIGGAKKKGDDFLKLRPYTQESYKQTEQDRRQSFTHLRNNLTSFSEKFREDKNRLWWEQYTAYLKTDKWKHLRQQVLERENFMCQGCHYSKAVHVHHTTYDNLGDELLFQLVALCVQCHNKLHPEKSLY